MKSGKCPKCGSANVRCKLGAGKIGHHGRIPSGGGFDVGMPVNRYVCAECGFVETFVDDAKARARVAEKWPLALRARDTG